MYSVSLFFFLKKKEKESIDFIIKYFIFFLSIDEILYYRYGCGRRFSVISNLRRHSKVHSRSTLQRTRLSSCERHYYVQKLIERTSLNNNNNCNDNTLQSNILLSRGLSNNNNSSSNSNTAYNQSHQQKKDPPTSFPLLSIQQLINHE